MTDMFIVLKRRTRRAKTSLISTILLIACLVVCGICAYNLINLYLEYKHGADVSASVNEQLTQDIETVYHDEVTGEEIETPFEYDHDAALAMNEYSVGYFWFPGTGIRLPLVQGDYNDQFLHTAYDFSYSRAGTLFIESALEKGLNDSHVIVYGHHMLDGSMFSKNEYYKDEDFFYENDENRYFYIYTPTTLRKYEIMSVFTTYPSDPDVFVISMSDEELQEYAHDSLNYTWYQTPYGKRLAEENLDVSQIVSLVNCEETDYGKRLVIQGSLVSEVPFKETKVDGYMYKPILEALQDKGVY